MNKLWLQAKSNIRKTKSATATLIIMFIIASFLLNAGLLVLINYGSFFNKLKNELKPTDAYCFVPDSLYTNAVKDFLNRNEHIEKTQIMEVLSIGAKMDMKGTEKDYPIMFCNMDEEREVSKWKFVDNHLPPENMSVYIPDYFKAVGGYRLNDKITLKYLDADTNTEKTLDFTIRGYVEDIFFSSTDTGYISFYLPDETYNQVKNILFNQKYKAHVVFTDLDDAKNSSKIDSGIRDILQLNSSSLIAGDSSEMLIVIDIDLVELSRCMMASIVSLMMVMFALIIAVVCLLVVRFRIVNSIEDDMMKLGSLKAIGYTSRQIILSILLQFGLIAGIGSIAGIALSYPALPAVASVFEQQSGLKWTQGFDGAISFMAFAILLLIVAFVSFFAARHVIRLSPINALRGESTARKYKKNRLPLEKAKGSLPFALAFKSICQNIKQSTMIAVVVMVVTFTGAFGVIMFYNTAIDAKTFAEVPGMEICNSIAVLNPEMDQTDAVNKIKAMDHVRKVQYFDEVKVKVDDVEASSYVMADYKGKETRLTYEGRYPEAHNEITLAGVLAERLDKKIGDMVTVGYGDKQETFQVVGLSNGSQMGGQNVSILTQDFQRLNPEFKPQSLFIYLNDGTDADAFTQKIESTFDRELLLSAVDFDKGMAEGMASYQNIVKVMGIVMLVITMLVVALVLYFVIGSSIIRRKRELGIQKAIGFTTLQLMHQVSVSFTVPIILGAIAGSLLGAFYTNPMMSIAMKSAGVMKANFIVDSVWIAFFGGVTIVFSYLLSMLVTWRIRKISAYALVTE